ncbi:MAG: LysR substrate-binding domain-containing protein, partial [Campylobacterota bacterium]
MTLTQLQCFYALCRYKSVSKAAMTLHKSQSALSLSIAALEKSLGEKLFDRVGKNLYLNERGRLFYRQSKSHYDSLTAAKSLFETEKIAGILHVSASKTIANYLLPQVYYDFLCRYENVALQANTQNSAAIIDDVVKGRLDMGFIENTPPHSAHIRAQKIGADKLLVLSSDQNAPKRCYIDSIDKRWIMREKGSGTREFFMQKAELEDNQLPIFMELGEFEAIKNILMAQKNTVGVLSDTAVEKELAHKKLFATDLINIDLRRDLFM